jgi:hypothetical protein
MQEGNGIERRRYKRLPIELHLEVDVCLSRIIS